MSGVLGLALAAAALAGCGGRSGSGGAAQNASRLLAAAAADDRVAFEAEIDRSAVREDLRRQMVALGRDNNMQVDGGPSDLALDRMIGPDSVRLVTAGAGQAVREAPSAEQLAGMLKMVGKKRACLEDPAVKDRCLMTFASAKGRWRLVGMQAVDLEIPVQAGG